MSDPPNNFEWWVEKAEHNLLAVVALTALPRPPWDIVCFHAQQAEKYLKGFLVFHNENPQKTHDLQRLLERCVHYDASLKILTPLCPPFTEYGGLSRYIDTPEERFQSAAPSLIAAAKEIRGAIRAKMRLDRT